MQIGYELVDHIAGDDIAGFMNLPQRKLEGFGVGVGEMVPAGKRLDGLNSCEFSYGLIGGARSAPVESEDGNRNVIDERAETTNQR